MSYSSLVLTLLSVIYCLVVKCITVKVCSSCDLVRFAQIDAELDAPERIRHDSYPLLLCNNSLGLKQLNKSITNQVRGLKIVGAGTKRRESGDSNNRRVGETLSKFLNLKTLRLVNFSKLEFQLIENVSIPTLHELTITQTAIKEFPGQLLRNLSNLKRLNLIQTNISHLDSGGLGITTLQALTFERNPLETLNFSFLWTSPSLQFLSLRKNGMKTIPEGLKRLKFLKELYLSDNEIESFHLKAFRKAPNLEILNLANNRINYLDPKALRGLYSLRQLDLTNNSITTLPERLFNHCPLTDVILWQNPMVCDCRIAWLSTWISQLATEDSYPDIEFECVLQKSGEMIKSTDMKALTDEDLCLDNENQPANESGNSTFKHQLCSPGCSCYGNLAEFRQRNPRADASTVFPFSICDGSPDKRLPQNLREDSGSINAINGNLATFGIGDILRYPYLKSLVLSNNSIAALKPSLRPQHSTKVETLFLDSNNLSTISKAFLRSFPQLRKIRLYNNQISRFPPDLFQYNKGLSKVFLGPNPVQSFDGECLKGLSLTYVGLRSLKIAVMPKTLRDMVGLQRIDLGENQITNLSRDDFITNVHLQSIRLDANRIKNVGPETFSHLSELCDLDLSENFIASLPDGFQPKTINPFLQFYLWQNPLVCDCDLRWFASWISKVEMEFPFIRIRYACSFPISMKGKTSDKTLPNEYLCGMEMSTSAVDKETTISSVATCISVSQMIVAAFVAMVFGCLVCFILWRFVYKSCSSKLLAKKFPAGIRMDVYGKIPSHATLNEPEDILHHIE